MEAAVVVGGIFLLTYIMIIWERVHHTIASMVGAVLMIVYGLRHNILTHEEIYAFIDLDTIGLLLGMMIIVGVLRDTGIFQWVAIKVAKITKGNPWYLMLSLSLVTAFFSMFFDNVTTIMIIIPVTIFVASELGISAMPLILAEVMFSNIGGVATLIGDPPNILIASAAGFGFNDFIIVLLPIVLGSLFVSLLAIRFLFRDWLRSPYVVMHSPRNRLGFHLSDVVLNIDEHHAIKNKWTMFKGLMIFFLTLYLFFIHEQIGLRPAMVAIIGATLTLLVNHPDPHVVFEKVEWPTLLFFASLFILVGVVAKVGLLALLGKAFIDFSQGNQYLSSVVMLWFGAFFSAFVDNIPFTAAMVPVIEYMGSMGAQVEIVWWGLAIGVGFGGNATLLASSASIIAVGFSEKYGEKITFWDWLTYCTPIMLISTATATILLTIYAYFIL
ncbi:ArsB/NhaD family transporter [Candidatus Altiarchaeota archaeon]